MLKDLKEDGWALLVVVAWTYFGLALVIAALMR